MLSYEFCCDVLSLHIQSEVNWMCIGHVHKAPQVSRFKVNSGECRCNTRLHSTEKKIDTRMMLKDCSEACPTSTVGCGYMSKLSTVAHCDYYLAMLYHSSRPSENKPLYSTTSPQEQNRKEQYNTCHKPSQRASQQSHGRRILTWIMNNNTILFEWPPV